MKTDPADANLDSEELLRMTADIVASYVSNNTIATDNLAELIRSVHTAMTAVAAGVEDRPLEKLKPAVPVNKSYSDDYIICLEDGKKLKMLKRYLRSTYGMSPEEYRKRWGLPADYPMVAPAYARRRSEFAKEIGLGRGVRRK